MEFFADLSEDNLKKIRRIIKGIEDKTLTKQGAIIQLHEDGLQITLIAGIVDSSIANVSGVVGRWKRQQTQNTSLK